MYYVQHRIFGILQATKEFHFILLEFNCLRHNLNVSSVLIPYSTFEGDFGICIPNSDMILIHVLASQHPLELGWVELKLLIKHSRSIIL